MSAPCTQCSAPTAHVCSGTGLAFCSRDCQLAAMAANTGGYREQVLVGDVTIATRGPSVTFKSRWDAHLQLGKTRGKSPAEKKMEKELEKLANRAEQHPGSHQFELPNFMAQTLHAMGKLENLGEAGIGVSMPNAYSDVIPDIVAYPGHGPVLLIRTYDRWTRDPTLQPLEPQGFKTAYSALDTRLMMLHSSLANRFVAPEEYYTKLLELFTRELNIFIQMGVQLDKRSKPVAPPAAPQAALPLDVAKNRLLSQLLREFPPGPPPQMWQRTGPRAYTVTSAALESVPLAEYEARRKAYIRPEDNEQCSDVATSMANWNTGLVLGRDKGATLTWVNQRVSLLILQDAAAVPGTGPFTVNGVRFDTADQPTRELHEKLHRKLLSGSKPKPGRCVVKK